MNRIPLPYAIPDNYIVSDVPEKQYVFSELIPDFSKTYKFGQGQQEEYYKHYRDCRFAYTKNKGGWDCLRHYEILMNGCIPVFQNLVDCPAKTMITFPKELVLNAMKDLLPWVETPENIELYNTYVRKLLDHTRKHCSISALIEYFYGKIPVLMKENGPDLSKKILMLNGDPGVNYSRDLLSIGLRQLFGVNFIEYPKNKALYKSCDTTNLIGNGYTYSGHLEDDESICRDSIEDRIKNHEFDLVIYGKVGHDEGYMGDNNLMPFFESVKNTYTMNRVVFIFGGDGCQDMKDAYSRYTLYLKSCQQFVKCFIRELNE